MTTTEHVIRTGTVKSWGIFHDVREYDVYDIEYTVYLTEHRCDGDVEWVVEGRTDERIIWEVFDNLAEASHYFEGVCDDC